MAEAEVDCCPEGFGGLPIRKEEQSERSVLLSPPCAYSPAAPECSSFREVTDPRESVRLRTLLHSGASWLLTNGISNPMETPRGGLKLVLTD